MERERERLRLETRGEVEEERFNTRLLNQFSNPYISARLCDPHALHPQVKKNTARQPMLQEKRE